MNVIRSEVMGFCSGVSRAVKAAEDALERNSNSLKKIYSLGPLIHNAVALSELERRGLKILEENQIDSLNAECVVLIRAHGVAPKILEQIANTGATIIDATCPRVALSQKRAAEYSAKGCTVFLAGDAGHGEVEAIKGSAGKSARVVVLKLTDASSPRNSASAAGDVVTPADVEGVERAILLAQTTFSPDEFKKIAAALEEQIPSLEVFDTICPATQKRQQALLDLAKKVDAIVVVGGKKSANTQRLYELACTLCQNTFFVENAQELKKDAVKARIDALKGCFKGERATIGITAGASTPDFVIEEVEKALFQCGN